MSEVFISYSRQNQDFVRRLANDLKQDGVDIWVDVQEIYGGDDWKNRVNQALDACRVMIFVISPESISSEHAQRELDYFIQENKPIIPIVHHTTEVVSKLYRLNYINFEDQDYHLAFLQLCAALSNRDVALKRTELCEENIVPAQPPLPLQIQGMLDEAQREVWISGIALDTVVRNNLDRILAALERGVRFRFLGICLDQAVLSSIAKWLGCSDFQLVFRVLDSMINLKKTNRTLPADQQLEIRAIPFRPAFGYMIVDPRSEHGMMTAAPYLYQIDELKRRQPHLKDQPPMFYLSRASIRPVDQRWFDLCLAEFEQMWATAQPWTLEDLVPEPEQKHEQP